MSRVLFIVGFLATCVGFVTLGFGIPINSFSLGNTLILAGTVMVAAGIILIGLSAVLRQLQRISQLLQDRTVRAPAALSGVSVPAPDMASSLTNDLHGRSDRPLDLSEDSTPLSWLRAKPKSGPPSSSMPEPPLMRSADEAAAASSLSSSRPIQPSSVHLPAGEAAQDKFSNAPDKAREPSEFEFAWPESSPRNESGMVPPQKEPVGSRVLTSQRGGEVGEHSELPAAQAPLEFNLTILKAGVIDGMAYRLYSDGSIEAEMPQGLIKFASIDELRLHLEKQG